MDLYARDINALTYQQLWDLPPGNITLHFDDGAIVTSMNRTRFCYYCWWVHREFPNTPLLMEHHLGNGYPTDDTAQKLIEKALKCALEAHGFIDPEYQALRIKQEINRIFNDFTYGCEEYPTSISALDFVDILDHPEILAANLEIQACDLDNPVVLSQMEKNIDNCQRKIRAVLMRPDVLPGNRLAETIRSNIVSIGQVLQCVGPRGFPTDIDSNVFPRPILYGYAEGIVGLEDSAKDSRSAAKALMFTKDPLADVEFFNRQMQLVVAKVRNLHTWDDCGSEELIPWAVRRNNVNSLLGTWYKDPESGQLVTFTPESEHLIGKTILIRSAMTCRHPDIYGVCGRCFGELRLNIPYKTNIGHCSVVVMCERVSQNVLSTKHLDGTAVVSEFKLSDGDAQYLRVFSSSFELGVSSALQGLDVSIIVGKDSIVNLADINLVDDATQLAPTRVSEMEIVLFKVTYEDGDEQVALVPVSMGSRLASFSGEFLNHIKRVGIKYTDARDIEITLDGWNRERPIWQLPRKHASMLEFMGRIENLVKSTGRNQGKVHMDLTNSDSLAAILTDFHDLVSEKFTLNVAHLSTILRATMVRSKKEYDYRLPEPGGPREAAGYNELMFYGSVSQTMAYQQQADLFRSPFSYTLKQRPTHPFDPILVPKDR